MLDEATSSKFKQQGTMLANRVKKRFKHLHKRFARQQIEVFRLYDGDIPEIRAAVDWLNRFGDPYQASGYDAEGQVGLDLGVYGLPETFVVDSDGTIAYKHVGPLTEEIWEDEIRPLMDRLTQAQAR